MRVHRYVHGAAAARAGRMALLALALAGCAGAQMEPAPVVGEREASAPSVGTVTLGGEAARVREPRRKPGTPVADPFRPGEVVADWGGVSVNAGRAGGAAYLYTPDHRTGMVAGSPERAAADLAYANGDWHVECGAEDRPWRCRLRLVSRARQGGRPEAALRIRSLSAGGGLIVCAGALDASAPAIRTGEAAPERYGGADGCFPAAESARILDELQRSESFAYHYVSGTYGNVSGWRSTFGLAEGLELMRWMQARSATG